MKEPAQNAIPHADPLQLGCVTKEQGGIGKIKKKQSEKLQRDAHISNKKLPNRDSGYVGSIYWESDDHDETDNTQPVKPTETYKGELFPHCDSAFNWCKSSSYMSTI